MLDPSRIAVQVVLYKGAARLPKLLASLKAQTVHDWELHLYDNSCDPAEEARVVDPE